MTPRQMAALHAQAFPHAPWTDSDIGALCNRPGTVVFTDPLARGFLLAAIIADEAEIITLATATAHLRQGVATGLLNALITHCESCAIGSVILEMRQSNTAARALYAEFGFAEVGQRKGYYALENGAREDALILHRAIPAD